MMTHTWLSLEDETMSGRRFVGVIYSGKRNCLLAVSSRWPWRVFLRRHLVLLASEVPECEGPAFVALHQTLGLLASDVPDGKERAEPATLPRTLVSLASVVPALTNLINSSRRCFPFAFATAIFNPSTMASSTWSCLNRCFPPDSD